MQLQNLSNYKLFSGNMGELLPCGLYEVMPKDYIRQQTQMLIRMLPMAAPTMHPTKAFVRHFEIPMRLLWDGWEDFITGADEGGSTFPVITVPSSPETNAPLLDYLGIPVNETVAGMEISALPVRAFNAVFNEYFRDQDLVAKRLEDDMTMPYVAWERDPFTAARPWAQKGAEVTLPLGTEAPVKGIGKENQTFNRSNQAVWESDGSNPTYASEELIASSPTEARWHVEEDPNNPGYPNIYADLSNAAAATVNDLRKSMAIQRYQEARAQYGSRYVEYLRYIGVKGPLDARLNNPLYLGGGHQTISYSEVLATAEAGTSVVGDLKGHGIAAMRSNAFRRYFQEFGYCLSLFYVRPKTVYTQGMDKHWLKRTKEEFFQKELALIGNQEVYNGEVYAPHTTPKGTFGWFDRYYDYTAIPSKVAGEFRSTLDYWHQARKFSTDPVLNESFVTSKPDARIFQDQTGTDQMQVMLNHSIRARRAVRRSPVGRII